MKLVFKAVFSILLIVLILGGAFLGYLSLTEYKPEPAVPVQIFQHQQKVLEPKTEFSITSFNIGYASLDKDTDFFMDGGTMSRASSRERVEQNLAGIIQFLQTQDSHIYLLQEVDENSSRSFKINQRERITKALPQYSSSFALNYQVAWVPVPLTRPMGRVTSGIQTLSKFSVHEATRFSLASEASWPTRLAHLKRCLLESRLPVANGKELVLAHIHLSAFDLGGVIRNQQLEFIESYARQELAKGNYVIIGGDWNHLLAENPQEKRARLSANWPFWLELLPQDFLPEFTWAFDEEVPTNRTVEAPYDPRTTFVSTIDGFLISPNVEIIQVSTHDLGFELSDHNPVTVTLRLLDPHQLEIEENDNAEI